MDETPERDAVRRGYDQLDDAYAAERTDITIERDVLETLLAPLPKPVDLLDAGCGPGTPAVEHVADAVTAVGLDVSRAQLELARTAPYAALLRGDMTALPIRDDAVDAVVAYHSLIHVPLDDHRTALDEFARVLRPGGRLAVSEGGTPWRGANPDWLDSGVEMQWGFAGREATREQLEAAGFTILDERVVEDELAADDARDPFFLARRD